ncbi:hypothetical protein [Mucilaginibacter phyllosphaerae]|uniref:Uncharacterized protein n=1 Tax=Mucilaginibacter phyllosphaerae TaxID=1812349 RepID=A0A4Y8AEF0_9SPHI|nr:hypothetical protein [Mucilaginibacter phyllosphaerae]MBB3970069.1 hypothetical protein [Mucilaginibacter phyllosphaerae]TEW66461.1 hypothetical protein E2R65_08515 [Mucilaginibacter phyllosphaerae]
MKAIIIKYISLLLFSGLILPLYLAVPKNDTKPAGHKFISAAKTICRPTPGQTYYITIQDIAALLIPQLKK